MVKLNSKFIPIDTYMEKGLGFCIYRIWEATAGMELDCKWEPNQTIQ